MLAPFVAEGLACEEPIVVVVDDPTLEVVRSLASAADQLVVLAASAALARPASRLQAIERAVDDLVAAGAPQVRIVSTLPVRAPSRLAWQPWARFEAYLERALEEKPVWHLCLYDRGDLHPDALADVIAVHPVLTTPTGGHEANPAAEPAASLLASHLLLDVEPGEPGPPSLELQAPSASDARRAVAELASASGLSDDDGEAIVSSVSEVVTNALVHGRPPVALCAWARPGRAVVTVTDHGAGPVDAAVGLAPMPREPGEGGFGLWIAHQLCDEVTLHRHQDAFAIRLAVGDEPD